MSRSLKISGSQENCEKTDVQVPLNLRKLIRTTDNKWNSFLFEEHSQKMMKKSMSLRKSNIWNQKL